MPATSAPLAPARSAHRWSIGSGTAKEAGIASADGCAQRIEQDAESCAARVDDAAGREHIELLPGAEQGFARREGCCPADLGQVQPGWAAARAAAWAAASATVSTVPSTGLCTAALASAAAFASASATT